MVFGELSEASPDSYRPDLAQALDNLGVRFSELEMPEEALEAAQKAVAIHRDLAAGNPDRYFPDLASSLDSLGFRFWSLGRARDALPVAQEAIGIYRKLAAASPDRHRVGLARALSHLGICWRCASPRKRCLSHRMPPISAGSSRRPTQPSTVRSLPNPSVISDSYTGTLHAR